MFVLWLQAAILDFHIDVIFVTILNFVCFLILVGGEFVVVNVDLNSILVDVVFFSRLGCFIVFGFRFARLVVCRRIVGTLEFEMGVKAFEKCFLNALFNETVLIAFEVKGEDIEGLPFRDRSSCILIMEWLHCVLMS